MSRKDRRLIGIVICVVGIALMVLANVGIISFYALTGPAPTALTVTASAVNVKPGEVVTFQIAATPSDAGGYVTFYCYVNNVEKGQWGPFAYEASPIILDLVPSVIGSETTWKAICGSVESNTVDVTVSQSIQPPLTISLSAQEYGGNLVFNVLVGPVGSYTGTLKAYSDFACAHEVGTWSLPIVSGVGSLTLNPASQIWGSGAYWKANINGVDSNIVSTQNNTVTTLPIRYIITGIGAVLAVIGAAIGLLYRKI